MKLDPGMHIGLHLVFFGKTGVTSSESNNYSPVPYGELHALRFKAELEVEDQERLGGRWMTTPQ
jgi:hypothetical protein